MTLDDIPLITIEGLCWIIM